MSDQPSDKELRAARDEFHALLAKQATEPELQALFESCPHILSRSLPLKIEVSQIVPTTPGTDKPDFVVYPRSLYMPTAAVVELKRPDHKIATKTRSADLSKITTGPNAIAQMLHPDARRTFQVEWCSRCARTPAVVEAQSAAARSGRYNRFVTWTRTPPTKPGRYRCQNWLARERR